MAAPPLAKYLPGWLLDWQYAPCAFEPWIGIKALYMTAGRIGWSLLDPRDSPKEELHKATGRSWLKNVKIVMQDAEEIKPKWFAPAEEGFYAMFEAIDMAIWYAFLYEVAEEGLSSWTSMIYRMEGCKHAVGHHIKYGKGFSTVGYTSKGWNLISGVCSYTQPDFWEGAWEIFIPPGGWASLSFEVHMGLGFIGGEWPINTAIIDDRGVVILGTERKGSMAEPDKGGCSWVQKVYHQRPGHTIKAVWQWFDGAYGGEYHGIDGWVNMEWFDPRDVTVRRKAISVRL